MSRRSTVFPRAATILGGLVLAVTGCRTVPPPAPVPAEEAAASVSCLRASTPEEFKLLTTVTFAFFGRSLTGLGMVNVDAPTRSFSVVALNHVGVKLFEIAETNGAVARSFALPMFTQRGDFVGTVAADIARVYLDPLPSARATATAEPEGLVFGEPEAAGTIERVLDDRGRLVEKRFREGRRLDWSIRYRDFRTENGKTYPALIELHNRHDHYALTVRLKQILK